MQAIGYIVLLMNIWLKILLQVLYDEHISVDETMWKIIESNQQHKLFD